MTFQAWLLSGVSEELTTIKATLARMETIMDQERAALDALTEALKNHCDSVDAACAKIIELINVVPEDPDVDNSAEIAALAGQIQASTDQIKATVG